MFQPLDVIPWSLVQILSNNARVTQFWNHHLLLVIFHRKVAICIAFHQPMETRHQPLNLHPTQPLLANATHLATLQLQYLDQSYHSNPFLRLAIQQHLVPLQRSRTTLKLNVLQEAPHQPLPVRLRQNLSKLLSPAQVLCSIIHKLSTVEDSPLVLSWILAAVMLTMESSLSEILLSLLSHTNKAKLLVILKPSAWSAPM